MTGKEFWRCPECGREFRKRNQQHSCTFYPMEKHLEGKDFSKGLYTRLKYAIEKSIGPLKVEALPCCIHFVAAGTVYTFAAVYALRDRIRIHFTLGYELKTSRLKKYSRMSASRYLYSIDIRNENELDDELVGWLRQAYNMINKEIS